jgi:uncharacterized membrane protein
MLQRLPFRVPRQWGPVRWFVGVAAVLGTLFAVVLPPFAGYDEPLHFLRAWQVGDGRVLSVEDRQNTANRNTEGLGGRFPSELRTDIIELIQTGVFAPGGNASLPDLLSHLNDDAPRGRHLFIAYPSAAVYSPVPYLPSALAIDIGRALHLSTLACLLLARLAGLAAYIALVALAIRRLPKRKWVLTTLGLAPIVIFQAATVTADTVTAGFAILLVANALRLASLPTDGVPTILLVETAAVTVALALCKQPYILVAAFLLLPAWKHRGRVATALATGAGVAVVLGGWWSKWAQDHYTAPTKGITSGASYAYHDVDSTKQLHFVRSHPFDFLQAIGSSLGKHGFDYARDALGQVGGWNTPWLLVLIVAILIAIALSIDGRPQPMARATSIIAAVLIVVLLVALFLLAYAGWNAVGAPRIDEFQGRYLYPLVALLVLAAIPAIPGAANTSPARALRVGRLIVATETLILALVLLGIYRLYY